MRAKKGKRNRRVRFCKTSRRKTKKTGTECGRKPVDQNTHFGKRPLPQRAAQGKKKKQRKKWGRDGGSAADHTSVDA